MLDEPFYGDDESFGEFEDLPIGDVVVRRAI
jgi:hypothetical protein